MKKGEHLIGFIPDAFFLFSDQWTMKHSSEEARPTFKVQSDHNILSDGHVPKELYILKGPGNAEAGYLV
jgi:hypothetical protein